MLIPVEDVREGQLLDLSGDQYADPDNSNAHLDAEYAVVLHDAYRETPECTTLHIEDVDLFGFPVGHKVETIGTMKGYEHELDPGDQCMCGYTLSAARGSEG